MSHTSPIHMKLNCMSTGTAEQYKKLCQPPFVCCAERTIYSCRWLLVNAIRPTLLGRIKCTTWAGPRWVLILVIFHPQKVGSLCQRSEMCGQVPRPCSRCYFVQRSFSHLSPWCFDGSGSILGPLAKLFSQQLRKNLCSSGVVLPKKRVWSLVGRTWASEWDHALIIAWRC